jgi:EAL domain-containing protein (putative c-di-GMP-specific phosphodiesterase class I)
MDASLQRRRHLELALRRALAAQQFVMFYQPMVDLKSEKITGFEALLRWQHPERGIILPSDFMAVAEEIGIIVPIGYWVLRRVCERARHWQDLGLNLPVAVNLSASQFHEPALVDELAKILESTNVAAAMIELEITESMVMRDPEGAARVMHALHDMGVRIAIDDFGTGHSSLGYLRRFPIDRLKVDRSFVRDLPHNSDDVAITRAVIAMAHSLRMSVVAEGVELQEQFDALRDEGCDEFQGYYCARPLDEGDLLRFIAGHQPPSKAARSATSTRSV